MIIQLDKDCSKANFNQIQQSVEAINYKYKHIKTQFGDYLVCIGKNEFDIRTIGSLKGISDVHRVSDQYKLVSAKWKVGRTVIDLGDGVQIGGDEVVVMAGPCSIEGRDQIESSVEALLKSGVKIMRGGVFKPRSSPYSFRGIGLEGLKEFYKICRDNGIKIITEVMQSSQIEDMYPYVDIFQVGARNSQNFNLLDALGEIDKTVMIKRGISGSIDELLQSAEYVFSGGNERIMLCERGIRTHETAYRNTLDLNAIPILKKKSHLPVISDPSHGIGIREFVVPMSLASVAAGADGVIVEAHEFPHEALSDSAQTISHEDLDALVKKIRALELSLRN